MQFANIPTDIHRHIADFFRPRKWTKGMVSDSELMIDPFSKAKDVAHQFLFNAYWEELEFELPKSPGDGWYLQIDTAATYPNDCFCEAELPRYSQNKIKVGPRSIVVLISQN